MVRKLLSFLVAITYPMVAAYPSEVKSPSWAQIVWHAAKRHGVDPDILMAISFVESRHAIGNFLVAPWTFAYRSPNGSKYFKNQKELEKFIIQELLAGVRPYQMDIGGFQVNARYGREYAPSILSLASPHTNAEVAASMLHDAMQSTKDFARGVGRYHSYHDELAIPYGRRVLQIADRIKKLDEQLLKERRLLQNEH